MHSIVIVTLLILLAVELIVAPSSLNALEPIYAGTLIETNKYPNYIGNPYSDDHMKFMTAAEFHQLENALISKNIKHYLYKEDDEVDCQRCSIDCYVWDSDPKAGKGLHNCKTYVWVTLLLWWPYLEMVDQGNVWHQLNISEKPYLTWDRYQAYTFYSERVSLPKTYVALPSVVVYTPGGSDVTLANGMSRNKYSLIQDIGMCITNINFYTVGLIGVSTGITCKNGQYANWKPRAVNGYPIEQPPCTACAPGYWNTCRGYNGKCKYHVQIQGETSEEWFKKIRSVYRDEINLPISTEFYELVGRCFPCRLALSIDRHNDKGYPSWLTWDTSRNSLPFYCPGGESEPIVCSQNSEAFMDKDGLATGCNCKAGYYMDGVQNTLVLVSTNKCTICPAGWYCTNGVKTVCPIGTYSFEGRYECSNCTTSACANPEELRPMCMEGSVRDEEVCVNCAACSNLGSSLQGAKQCILKT
jgi:hypothetical protein